ncbi:MAG: hypothetical protein ACI4IK_01455 [Eubacterium sp.]
MTTIHAIQTTLELAVILLIIYGYVKEDALIRVETKIKRRIYNAICKYESRKDLMK